MSGFPLRRLSVAFRNLSGRSHGPVLWIDWHGWATVNDEVVEIARHAYMKCDNMGIELAFAMADHLSSCFCRSSSLAKNVITEGSCGNVSGIESNAEAQSTAITLRRA